MKTAKEILEDEMDRLHELNTIQIMEEWDETMEVLRNLWGHQENGKWRRLKEQRRKKMR